MEESSSFQESDSSTEALRSTNWLIPLLLCLTLLSGMGIGALLSGGTSAGQTGHVIKVSDSEVVPTGPIATAMALSEAFAQVARAVEPAVVHIETESGKSNRRGDPFDFFFDRSPGGIRRGTGSGVIVDPAGYILTNNHVLESATAVRVKLRDGQTFTPKIIGSDPETDLVVIKISRTEPFPHARVGDSTRLKVGDWVLAIGSPFGLEQTVTAGIISAKDRVTDGTASQFQQFLQTDAAINPGNSGGPLINLMGEVVGINTQIPTNTGFFNGIGFALPSSLAVEIYNQLVSTGKVTRGYLGIFVKPVTPQVARLNGLKEPRGALIDSVTDEKSPAAQVGLESGDIIIEFEGQPIQDSRDLTRRVAATDVGRTVRIKYVRGGREYVTSVKLSARPPLNQRLPLGTPEERPRNKNDEGEKKNGSPARPNWGATLEPVTPHVASALKLGSIKGALVREVENGSVAEEIRLIPGDVILSINRKGVDTPDQVKQIFESLKPGDDVVIQVARPNRSGTPGRAILSGTVP